MGAVNGQLKRWGAYGLVHLFGILSILAQPMAVSLPLILLLMDRFQGRKISRAAIMEKMPLFLVLASVAYLTLNTGVAGSGGHPGQAFLIICWSALFYVRQYVVPLGMVPIVRLPIPISYSNPEYLWSVGALLIVLLSASRLRKSRWVYFCVGFFLCSLVFLVTAGLIKNVSFAADRYMYLPGMSFCLLIGAGIQWVYGRWGQRSALSMVAKSVSTAIIMCFCIAMASVTYRQTYVWQNDVALWRHQLANNPNEPIALNGLAVALREYDDFVVAEKEYRKMVSIVGQGYELRMDAEAQEHVRRVHYIINLMQRAKLAAPDLAEIPYKLGRYYQALGLYANAVAEYRTAVDVDPGFKDVYLSLGRIYLDLKDLDKAALAFSQFCVLRPVQEKDFLQVVET
ncbi:MAG: tetratricopeptide repeat protein, partial [Candidatus Omnitrophica bacterium]|nr:tetratricopeptide repeat protein [Candidatus Omnitrophota bacterium]